MRNCTNVQYHIVLRHFFSAFDSLQMFVIIRDCDEEKKFEKYLIYIPSYVILLYKHYVSAFGREIY